jgi:hypothetical protein
MSMILIGESGIRLLLAGSDISAPAGEMGKAARVSAADGM